MNNLLHEYHQYTIQFIMKVCIHAYQSHDIYIID